MSEEDKKFDKTAKEIDKKIDELCNLINDFEGSTEAAIHVCEMVVCVASTGMCHGLGIFQEAMLRWREDTIVAEKEMEREEQKAKLKNEKKKRLI